MDSRPKLSIVGGTEHRPKCQVCGYGPCVCHYFPKLEPGGEFAHLASVAATQMDRPLPHRDGCPCPGCYSDRLRTFQVVTA